MKKNPNLISDEELLKLLEESEEDSDVAEYSFDSSVLSFVQSFNLKPGKDKIVKKQLYKLYKLWNKGIQKLTQTSFTHELSNYIEHKGSYFLVDKSLFDIANFIKEEKQRNTRDRTKSKYWHKHITDFLTFTKLEEGTIYIELEILNYIYMNWVQKSKRKIHLSRRQLIKILDLYFDVTAISTGSHLWVGVNEQIENLITKKEVDRWRKYRAKKKKASYYPKEEWKKFALYWEENKEKIEEDCLKKEDDTEKEGSKEAIRQGQS